MSGSENNKKFSINRGSEWRKWDLHYHVFDTHLNNQYKCTEEEYLEKLENSDIAVYGLTDYWTAYKQYDLIDKFYKKYPYSNKKFFVNVEFRLDQKINDSCVNAHVIFDYNDKKDDVIDAIDHMGLRNTISSGKQETISELKKREDYDSVTISVDSILEKLKKHVIPYFLVIQGTGYGSIRPKSGQDMHRTGKLSDELDKKADFFFGNKSQQDYFLGKNRYGNSKDESNVSIPKPCILGSDYHGDHRDKLNNYTWIKTDATFEGLRQILFEPKERVMLPPDNPESESKSNYQIIDYFKLGTKTYYFNENLNAIIGGRSTGKSTLLNSIAKNTGNDIEKEEESNHYLNTFKNDSDNFEVVWKDNNSNNKSVEFIPQDYMIELARDDKKRNDLIKNVIFSKGRNKTIDDYHKRVNGLFSELRAKIQDLLSLRDKLLDLDEPEGDLSSIEKQINNYENHRKKLLGENGFTEDDNSNFLADRKRVSDLNNHVNNIDSYYLNALVELEQADLINYDLNELNYQLPENYQQRLKKLFDVLKCKVNARWSEEVENIFQEMLFDEKNYKEQISKLENSELYIKGLKYEENNSLVKDLQNKIDNEQKHHKRYEEYQDYKNNLESNIKECKDFIFNKLDEIDVANRDISEQSIIISEDKSIDIKLAINNIEITTSILNQIRTINKTVINLLKDSPIEGIKYVLDENDEFFYNGGFLYKDLINFLFAKEWYTENYILKYEDADFDKMSQGKKSFVILKLILDFSDDKKPILIDQPEDSLDNRAIYKDLTKYIRSKKNDRQIILVTHNPNIVIGADAENVFVADQTDQEPDPKFNYVNGSIENTKQKNKRGKDDLLRQGIREHIIEILEGGKEALEKREHRYGY